MTPEERDIRFKLLRSVGCVACRINGSLDCGLPEIHHLNKCGQAGRERRGDEHTVCLGVWHHRGVAPYGMTSERAEELYGPSLARQSKAFREHYGTDDHLLEHQNKLIENRIVEAA
jgi:hypothetical protein